MSEEKRCTCVYMPLNPATAMPRIPGNCPIHGTPHESDRGASLDTPPTNPEETGSKLVDGSQPESAEREEPTQCVHCVEGHCHHPDSKLTPEEKCRGWERDTRRKICLIVIVGGTCKLTSERHSGEPYVEPEPPPTPLPAPAAEVVESGVRVSGFVHRGPDFDQDFRGWKVYATKHPGIDVPVTLTYDLESDG
ncbi:MAG: hypothetical protein KAJ55_00205 [Anaerolineales bacterium]|nr:hypothetical protein [Anaerolineales bacterium]